MAVWIPESVSFFDYTLEKDTFIFDTFEERRLLRAGIGVFMDDELAEILIAEKEAIEERERLEQFVLQSQDENYIAALKMYDENK